MKTLSMILSIVVCLTLFAFGHAQHCSTSRTVVSYPVQSYGHANQNYQHGHNQNYLVVPYAVPTYGGYYSLQDYYSQQAKLQLQSQQNDQSKAYLEIIKLLIAQQQQNNGQLLPQQQPLQLQPQAQSNTSDPQLVAYINQSCIKCHNSITARGGLNLENLDSLSQLMKYKMATEVCCGSMPQGGQPAPDNIKKLFCEFAKQ